jgi:ATP phosphoribosyltransferase regulatory subunit
VETDISGYDIKTAKKYAEKRGIGGIIFVPDNENIELHNIKTGEVTKTSQGELKL